MTKFNCGSIRVFQKDLRIFLLTGEEKHCICFKQK